MLCAIVAATQSLVIPARTTPPHMTADALPTAERPAGKALRTLVMSRELRQTLSKEERMKVVLYSQPACPACRVALSHMRQIADEHADTEFAYIELGGLTSDAFEEHAIQLVPTIAIYNESGMLVDDLVAATLTYDELSEVLSSCLVEGAVGDEDECEVQLDYLSSDEVGDCDNGGPCELTYD